MDKDAYGKEETKVESETTIEDLYKYFGILADAKENASEHVETYLAIINGTKSGAKQKQLSCQFITRFFKYFPKEMPIAVDAIFDLCEDTDVNIRKSAIKDLAQISKFCSPEHLVRIADILTQLLQTDDQSEFQQVQTSLLSVLKLNPKSTLEEIFNQINITNLEQVRKRAIKFLCSKLPLFFEPSESQNDQNTFSNKDLQDLIVKNVKQTLADVDAEEFILFIRLLASLPSMTSLQGRQDLVNIIIAQSELDKPFNSNDLEQIMILLSCIQQAIPLFSKNVQSTKYVNLYIENVLTIFNDISDEAIKFEILKYFAELCTHYMNNPAAQVPLEQTKSSSEQHLTVVFDLLLSYLPLPSESHEKEEEKDKEKEAEETKFNFSYVECLLYAFHILISKLNQDFLNSPENKERLRDFRLKLQYFAKGTQNYIKELKNTLLNTALATNPPSIDNEENKIRRAALKVTTNIDALIKDFFHNPPCYKTSIVLSWKSNQSVEAQNQIQQQQQQAAAAKRSLSVSNEDGARKKPERGIYQPPSGKYSTSNHSNQSIFNNKRRTFSSDNNNYRVNNLNKNGNSRF